MKKLLFVALLVISGSIVRAQDKMLETLGASTAVVMYNTYLVIGTVSDGYTGGVYDAEYAITLLREQEAMADNISTNLRALLDSGELASAEDRAFVEECIACMNGLSAQANYGALYFENKDSYYADRFETQRTTNWSKIAELLGLEE